ncbi:transcription factor IIIB, Bdp1 subunit [Xylona heveae TC161]|uniref:Transcription factor IIIB, Bdp1 subunit n=1 Tax=Xylona heveae (strain CBS 132557 / TC161) TaxID=1328760 RepID=A0A165GVX3_XYLHT|nr:transcription factor IIIB, Bdp1 subunit [Xylona heveae TC161]KZF22663.1 transcription factor IIIB, Bdp1 subunit [Xylona heveae TC161]
MSTFGSSVINKSGKKLAPKAPLGRRRAGPATDSTQAITRASEERPPPSHISQPVASNQRTTDAPAPDSQPSEPRENPLRRVTSQHSVTEPRPPENPPSPFSTPTHPESHPESQPHPIETETQKSAEKVSDAEKGIPRSDIGPAPQVRPVDVEPSLDSLNVSSTSRIGEALNESLTTPDDPTASITRQEVALEPSRPDARTSAQRAKPPKSQPPQSLEGPTTGPAPKRRKLKESRDDVPSIEPRSDTDVQPTVEATSSYPQEANVESSVDNSKRKTRARAQKKAKVSDDTRNEESEPTNTRKSREPKGTRRGRKRQKTPENAETMEIAPSIVKMADLCRDNRQGKKSKRETELQNMDWTAVIKRQNERQAQQEAGEIPAKDAVGEMLERAGQEQERQSRGLAAPQMRLINGQIVLDDQSLQIDRHAHAARDQEAREEVEENELTRRITAGSWMKREKTEPWTDDYTDLFYQGLRMFGTDFMMISKMFPNRSRRQIKLKFCKEERLDPLRIHEALMGPRQPVDLAHYSEMTNEEYGDPAVFEQELAAEAERFEAEHLAQKAGTDISGLAKGPDNPSTGDAGNGDSAKENEGQEGSGSSAAGKKAKKPAGKNKKSLHSRNGVSDEVEVLGTVDELMQR